MKTKVEIIEDMIELIGEPEHWCKGMLYDGEGAYCLVGALNVAAVGLWDKRAPEVMDLFGRLAVDRGYNQSYNAGNVVRFNNDPRTTHEDIMLFLKEALVDAQIEESTRRITEGEK